MTKRPAAFLLVVFAWGCSSPPAPAPAPALPEPVAQAAPPAPAAENPVAESLPPPSPAGGELSKLAVLALPSDLAPEKVALVIEALSQGIVERYGLEVVGGSDLQQAVWSGKAGGPPRQCLDEYAAILRDGQKALERFQLSAAGERLARAKSLLDVCGAYVEQGHLVGLYLAIGKWMLAREQRDEALAAFRQASVFSPSQDARMLGLSDRPALVFEEARRAVLSGVAHPLGLGSWPPGATVFIDGVNRGKTPLAEIQLYGGIHFLRMELDGHSSWTRVLPDAVPPEKIEVKLTPIFRSERLRALAAELGEGQPGAEAKQEMSQLCAKLEVDGAMLVAFYLDKGALDAGVRLFYAAGGVFSAPRRYSLGSSEKAWQATARRVAATMREFKAAPADNRGKQPAEEPKKEEKPKKKNKTKKKKKSR